VNIAATAEGLVQSSTDYGMNVLTSLNSYRSVFGSGSPRLGLAPAGELSLSLYLNSASVPRMAEIRPYFRVVNDTQQSEWIAKGVYYVDTREADTTTGLLTLHAYDAMLKGEQVHRPGEKAGSLRLLEEVRQGPGRRLDAGFLCPA